MALSVQIETESKILKFQILEKMVVRKGGVIKLKPEAYDEYKVWFDFFRIKKISKMLDFQKYHAEVWPKVLERIELSNMRNYVIYYSKKLGLLFSHFEYVGTDFDADMAKIAADPETKVRNIC